MASSDETSTFIGFLANVDSTILDVEFSPGTKLGSFELVDAIRLLMELGAAAGPGALRTDLFIAGCLHNPEQRIYYVERPFPSLFTEKEEAVENMPERMVDDSLVILNDKLRLARLFKRGNLQMPRSYQYQTRAGRKFWGFRAGGGMFIPKDLYHLEPNESTELNEFLRAASLPFGRPYIDLSFRAFEASYIALGTGLPFLALFSGLEALLNPAYHEIRYRLSRNTACLMAGNADGYRLISRQVGKWYDKRSAFIHAGEERKITIEDVTELRELLRRCIMKAYQLDLDKESLMQELDERGFPASPPPPASP